MAGQVLINGKAFSASDITLTVSGIDIASVNNLTVTEAATKENNYGFASEPASRGEGPTEYTCTIGIAWKDVLKLKNIAPLRRLTKLLMFNVLAVFDNGETISRIRVRNAEFMEDGFEVAQGDTQVIRDYPLIIAGIDYLPST